MRLIPDRRRGMLWRFALGALIVIAFTATTTAVAGLLQFKQFTDYLALSPVIKNAAVSVANPGNPQTLLLIGSDHRAGEPFSAANTDTMMLVRLDPNSSTINVLSVPRDLKVQIQENGVMTTDKVNSAYSIGGPNLLLKVLKQEVFPGLHVNHIIDVNFGGFVDLVNAIGCVYADVDHRYYNNTAYTDYSSIDIQPGYQKLCGTDALEFVRFRHTDNDIVRNARQQDFLRWAKDRFSSTELFNNRNKLIKIFGQHTETDHNLHTIDGLINLFDLVAFSAGHAVKQVPFPAIFLPCNSGAPAAPGVVAATQTPCYVTADAPAEARAYRAFMTPTQASSASASNAPRKQHGNRPPTANLTSDLADGTTQASAMPHTSLPVYVPRLIAPESQYCTNATCPIGPIANSYPRAYRLRDQQGHTHPAYRLTLVINPGNGLDEYYGVQGTTWQNPPILNKPTETETIGGKQLMLFFNGHQLTLAAWRTPQGVYWISNTLNDTLTNKQMLGIASSLTPVG